MAGYAQHYLSAYRKSSLEDHSDPVAAALAELAKAWIDFVAIKTNFWIKWHCPAETDGLTPDQLDAKLKALGRVVEAYVRIEVKFKKIEIALKTYEKKK